MDNNLFKPNSYKENIVSIVKGDGAIVSRSRNTIKYKLICPEVVLCWEEKFIGNSHQTFAVIANKFSVDPKTVRTYFINYCELRTSDMVTEDDVEIYLSNHGLEYPLLELRDLPVDLEGSLSLRELQYHILSRLESQKLLLELHTNLIEEIKTTNNTVQSDNQKRREVFEGIVMKMQSALTTVSSNMKVNNDYLERTDKVLSNMYSPEQRNSTATSIESSNLTKLLMLHLQIYQDFRRNINELQASVIQHLPALEKDSLRRKLTLLDDSINSLHRLVK